MAISPTFPHTRTYGELEQFHETAPAVLERLVEADPSRVLVVDGPLGLNRAQLGRSVAMFQRVLRDSGVRRGDVVAVQLPNWWETVAIAHAVWGMGAVLNPITAIYRGSELKRIYAAARPRLVITPGMYRDLDYVEMSRVALSEGGVEAEVLTMRDEVLDLGKGVVSGSGSPAFEVQECVDEVSLLMFTSGTTGMPKGVLHSQRTLLYEAWSIADRFSLRDATVFMPSPLTHITGLLYGVMLPLLVGGSVVLMDRWDPRSAVAEIESHACTFCVGATPFLSGLVEEYEGRRQTSSLGGFVCGGADVPPALVRDARRVMGTDVVRAYGLTEMPTLSCGIPTDPVDLLENTDGRLVGSSEARLANPVDGIGELEIHGPELFLGYLDACNNDGAFTPDGWFRTGDLALLRDGYVTIVGRAKDVIIRGGENISAKEIEDLILEMPNVAEVAIVGVPDPVLGERACVVIVAKGTPPALGDIAAHLDAAQVARQKIPERLIIEDDLPRTASGKIQKYALREKARMRLAAGEGEQR